ncbi:hypothetical protein N7457_009517 [Penicillium paradoxum]|uniref:uncharacterized protein n=1 Tax=Penicillium paradoxum TaxID=176176 RepID=UPI0025466297|nr:uncharacterized protein N7457_009517 [Penicillium paradoxum]KAJ5774621.1 hypothetical protein N7457_009517 [Penicillium paradoxum]
MTNILFLPFLLSIYFLGLVTAHSNHVSTDLFNSLEELSRIVDISYCVGTTGVQQPFQCLSHCTEFPDLELITTWNTGILLSDSCGYVALSHSPSPKRILIAFRGTYSLTNTIIDLSALPQSYIPYNPNTTKCENCTVHAGFMNSWRNTRKAILPHVSAARAKYPDYEVALVGHSLGGAVAALAGLEMQLKGWDPVVTTFGEPMVGNEEFAKFINQQFGFDNVTIPPFEGGRFRRVTHVDDPVPLLPLREWGYRAHSGEIFISRSELPPRKEDLRLCAGDYDPMCIARSESEPLLREMYREMNVPLGLAASGEDCRSEGESGSGEQAVLGRGRDSGCEMAREERLRPLRWDWSLIPARYRLWELFYAHRDYFWRIGLCVPGGDPTG